MADIVSQARITFCTTILGCKGVAIGATATEVVRIPVFCPGVNSIASLLGHSKDRERSLQRFA